MKRIEIPEDHYMGDKTIELELPWLTPESIHFLNDFLKPNFKVLEFGSGGSTLFFSRRCEEVTSFETRPEWMGKIKDVIQERNLENISYHPIEVFKEICNNKEFDCIIVDTPEDGKVERVDLMNYSLDHVKKGGLLILDNYGRYNYPTPVGFDEKSYDDSHWDGNGTKVYHKI